MRSFGSSQTELGTRQCDMYGFGKDTDDRVTVREAHG